MKNLNDIDSIRDLSNEKLSSYLDSRVKESQKINKKNVIREWRDNYPFAKRTYPWRTFIKIGSDGVSIGNENQKFSNRVLDFK